MTAIAFKKERAFDPIPHQKIAAGKMKTQNINLEDLSARFRAMHYLATENFVFQLGFGSHEPAHSDLPTWQIILVLQPHRWVLKSPNDTFRNTYQQPGDLIILNTGKVHEVAWDKFSPKPSEPWVYLFVDFYNRSHWHQQSMTLTEAEGRARLAAEELQRPQNLEWLKVGY